MSEADLLIKLFDTLKDSIRDMQQLCQAMLTNQTNIGNYVKNLPIDEVKELLKEHSKDSSVEIETCSETVETQADAILNEVKELKGKVKTMIIIVIVAFTLFTSAILIGKLSVDVEEIKKEIIEDLYKTRSINP
ncbi:hypothetical protein KAR91_16205 [Candidatus Pacearchaeota archaeon]|nr:hypothetical protein [Candidatus Pacearchaeota archaeon]